MSRNRKYRANRDRYIPILHIRDTYGGTTNREVRYAPRDSYDDARAASKNAENNLRRNSGFSGTFYSSSVERVPQKRYRRK